MSANSTTCSLCPFVSSILFGGKNVGKCGDQSMLPGETGLEIKTIKTLRNGYIKNSWWNNVYHVIFSDLTDLWVVKPMILCAHSTSRSCEQSTKCRSRSENVRKVCWFYSQKNKIVWLSNMADTFVEKFMRCTKVCGLFFLDCAFQTLIGWAGKLRSHGIWYRSYVCTANREF